jgi:hypothetical protein
MWFDPHAARNPSKKRDIIRETLWGRHVEYKDPGGKMMLYSHQQAI